MTRPLLSVVVALVLIAPSVEAQYFGTNRVQYRHFDWNVVETEHFDVYYYGVIREAALDAARMAERGYARLSRVLNWQFRERKPIILYASHSDFQQTTVPIPTGEGTGGVTEFFKHRIVLPFTGSYAEFDHVLQHELVHQFQYDVYARGRAGAGLRTLIAVSPPGWFAEGMAEYLSVGPIGPLTAMWLRDASVEGNLPTAEQLANDLIFPYRFGHAIWSYVGERWGDEVVGDILQSSANTGIPGALRQTLGMSFEELIAEWRDAVQVTYLPQLADHYRARRVAHPVVTEERSGGVYRLAPALSPDGTRVAFFGARDLFVDLWLADASSGRIIKRLVESTISSDFESLRFISSSTSWSPDGRFLALAAKRGPRDDLVLIEVRNGDKHRIEVEIDGILTPSFSPDGKRVVFTGLQGGHSDLYVVELASGELSRLTHDAYADLHPAWSPDGSTIAFATDRGPAADLEHLRYSNLRVALYHLATGQIEVLERMDWGTNVDPEWSPDGRSIAFVSDRAGISNVFLFELASREVYQLTDVYSGVSGLTETSPAISWAHEADRLAFTYFEDSDFNIYAIDNPTRLKSAPWDPDAPTPIVASLLERGRRFDNVIPRAPSLAVTPLQAPREAASLYRSGAGFRASGADPTTTAGGDSTPPGGVSVAALLDSARLALPDTSEFTLRGYKVRFTPDYVARPNVGYERDNFGQGVFGGTTIQLSDILGQHYLLFDGQINGRIGEARVFAMYANLARRINWSAGVSQDPVYFFRGGTPLLRRPDGLLEGRTELTRFNVRQVFAAGSRPFNRFRRLEGRVRLVNIDEDVLEFVDLFDAGGGFLGSDVETTDGPNVNFVQPALALVFDNALFSWTGPFMGRRSRFEVAPTIGGWRFWQITGDYRRYDRLVGPFTFATRLLYFGRRGRDADFFPIFLGNTELIRGYTAGSFRRQECSPESLDGSAGFFCPEFDQLVGSQIGVVNAELRFPITRSLVLGFLPIWFPPIDGALFYDMGIAFNSASVIKWRRDSSDSPISVRQPLSSYGFSIRGNLLGFLILRADYAVPRDRPVDRGFWTLSLGPSF